MVAQADVITVTGSDGSDTKTLSVPSKYAYAAISIAVLGNAGSERVSTVHNFVVKGGYSVTTSFWGGVKVTITAICYPPN